MKLKFCILLFFCFLKLQGSYDEQPRTLLNVDAERSKLLQEITERRTFVSMACFRTLDGQKLDRAGLKLVREQLEVVYAGQQGKVRDELDAITKNHKRKAPLFLGLVSDTKLNKERIALKVALEDHLRAEQQVYQSSQSQAVAQTPIVACAVEDNK